MSRVQTKTLVSTAVERSAESQARSTRSQDAKIPFTKSRASSKPLDVHAVEFVPSTRFQRIANNGANPPTFLPYEINSFPAATARLPYQPSTPPPSQALQPAFMPTFEALEASVHSGRYEDLLDRIEVLQEDLRDARDSLLGSRFRLRTKRRQLQTTRAQAVSEVGASFELMRRYFLLNGLDIPDEISAAWSSVDATRDTLGGLEVDFEEEEESYNKEEWQYTEKEKHFVESISRDTAAPCPPDDAVAAGVTHNSSTFFFELPDNYIIPCITTDVSLLPLDLDVIQHSPRSSDMNNTVEVKATTSKAVELPRCTTPRKAVASSRVPEVRRQSRNTTMNHDRVRWAETLKNIDGWMLDALEVSPIQRRWFTSLVPNTEMSGEALWQLVRETWFSASPDSTEFHTGDTTISGTALSQAISSSVRDNLTGSEISGSDTRPPSILPPFPDDRLAGVLTPSDNPAQIKVRDLIDAPRHVAFQIDPSSLDSVSTQPTIIPQGSPTSSPDHYSDAGSVSTQPTVITYASTSCGIGRSASMESVLTLSSIPANDSRSATSLLSTVDDVPQSLESAGVQIAFRATSHVARSARNGILDTDLPQDSSQHPSNPLHFGTMPLEDKFLHRNHKTPSQPATSHTRYPYAPFIRVKSPQPWNLPLLRLTPTPFVDLPPRPYSSNLENIPFVMISDTPFRLPGPSPFSPMCY